MEGTEAARIGLDELDFAVEPFGNGVGNRVAQIGEDVFQMALEHFGYLDNGFKLAAGGPPVAGDRPPDLTNAMISSRL